VSVRGPSSVPPTVNLLAWLPCVWLIWLLWSWLVDREVASALAQPRSTALVPAPILCIQRNTVEFASLCWN
jgi:hypothetical protein